MEVVHYPPREKRPEKFHWSLWLLWGASFILARRHLRFR